MESQETDTEARGTSYIHAVDVAASQPRYLLANGDVNKGEPSLTEVVVDPHHCAIHSTVAVQPDRPTLTQ